MRSFTLPPALKNSHFAKISHSIPSSLQIWLILTKGVSPMKSKMFFRIFGRVLCNKAHAVTSETVWSIERAWKCSVSACGSPASTSQCRACTGQKWSGNYLRSVMQMGRLFSGSRKPCAFQWPVFPAFTVVGVVNWTLARDGSFRCRHCDSRDLCFREAFSSFSCGCDTPEGSYITYTLLVCIVHIFTPLCIIFAFKTSTVREISIVIFWLYVQYRKQWQKDTIQHAQVKMLLRLYHIVAVYEWILYVYLQNLSWSIHLCAN